MFNFSACAPGCPLMFFQQVKRLYGTWTITKKPVKKMTRCHAVLEAVINGGMYSCFAAVQPAILVVIILQRQKNRDVIFSSNVSK